MVKTMSDKNILVQINEESRIVKYIWGVLLERLENGIWVEDGYYPTKNMALNEFIRKSGLRSNAKTFAELLQSINNARFLVKNYYDL